MIKDTIQVNDIIEIEIPHSSDRYRTKCIYINHEGEDTVVYGADGTRCKIQDVVAVNPTTPKYIFPNGFEDWHETHYNVVSYLSATEEFEGTLAERTRDVEGIGGMYLLAQRLTDEFELINQGVIWGDEKDYNDTLEKFFKHKDL